MYLCGVILKEIFMEIMYAVDTVKLPKRDKLLARKRIIKEDPFVEVFGMWTGRDIDASKLRKQAWGIEN